MDYSETLHSLLSSGNFRRIPEDIPWHGLDFSTNDYLGMACRSDLQDEFFAIADNRRVPMTSSASRLLASKQHEYVMLESMLADLYGRSVLLFNSGYHANVGLVSSLADTKTLIVADKLVHASIIDGIVLSRAHFIRFRHNDYKHLQSILEREALRYERVLILVESVYSMDGDCADIEEIAYIKRQYPNAFLYVDEAHAFGVLGDKGLGLCRSSASYVEVDVIMATLGKAVASSGAFCVLSENMRDYVVNRARSFIFSTALPPICCAWSRFIIGKMVCMDKERKHLSDLSDRLRAGLTEISGEKPKGGYIQPFIVGDAHRVVELSLRLLDEGIKVLPIRTPTVPVGTERLRISLNAGLAMDDVDKLVSAIKRLQ